MPSTSDSPGATRRRKRPWTVEIQDVILTNKARVWLELFCEDLHWFQINWRIWDSPAELHELSLEDQVAWRHYQKQGVNWPMPLKRRSVDAIHFASKKDARYFKLVFL